MEKKSWKNLVNIGRQNRNSFCQFLKQCTLVAKKGFHARLLQKQQKILHPNRRAASVIPLGTQSIAFINEERRVWVVANGLNCNGAQRQCPPTHTHSCPLWLQWTNRVIIIAIISKPTKMGTRLSSVLMVRPSSLLYLAFSRRRPAPGGWKFLIDFLIKNPPPFNCKWTLGRPPKRCAPKWHNTTTSTPFKR